MTNTERRKTILDLILKSPEPLSGGALGRETGVSRQVIVQDIALLRSEGHEILSTPRGYCFASRGTHIKTFKVRHTGDQSSEELNAIVDLGGTVLDVTVNHRVYGKMSAPLGIRTRRDVKEFMDNIRSGKSSPLLNVTSGYHFHRIAADSAEILDEIEASLREKAFLVPILPYETDI